MPKYHIGVREVHIAIMEINADSKEEAIISIQEGNGEEVSLEYSHTLDSNLWTVEEAK